MELSFHPEKQAACDWLTFLETPALPFAASSSTFWSRAHSIRTASQFRISRLFIQWTLWHKNISITTVTPSQEILCTQHLSACSSAHNRPVPASTTVSRYMSSTLASPASPTSHSSFLPNFHYLSSIIENAFTYSRQPVSSHQHLEIHTTAESN
jgi:hypothetical protein